MVFLKNVLDFCDFLSHGSNCVNDFLYACIVLEVLCMVLFLEINVGLVATLSHLCETALFEFGKCVTVLLLCSGSICRSALGVLLGISMLDT